MITYEDALKKARELKHNIDACDEYDVGYMFKAKADAFTIGGDGPCCIIKDTAYYFTLLPDSISSLSNASGFFK